MKKQIMLSLILNLSDDLVNIRKKYKIDVPPYLVVGSITDVDEVSKIKKRNVRLDEISIVDNVVSLLPVDGDIDKFCEKIKVARRPLFESGLVLANLRGKMDIYGGEDVSKYVEGKVSLPVSVGVKEVWLLEKEKRSWKILKKIVL